MALQEVDRSVARTARRDLPAELAVLTGMTAVFSNNSNFQGSEYGNAMLTRFPVKRWSNHHYQMLRLSEQWGGVLQLVLDVDGREIVFMNTHIDYRGDDSERWLNVGEIEKLAHESNHQIILCGDFNDVPSSRIYRRLSETFDDVWRKWEAGTDSRFLSGHLQSGLITSGFRKVIGLNHSALGCRIRGRPIICLWLWN